MRSFILGYEKRNTDENNDAKIDIHINFWRTNITAEDKIVIDFGFMIDDITLVDKLILLTPFQIDEVKDLGGLISKSNIIVDAIFNERCEISNIYPKRTRVIKRGDYYLSRKQNNEEFIIYSLNEDQIDSKNKSNYGEISIKTDRIMSNNELRHQEIKDIKTYYFRIRIETSKYSNIIQKENEKINILQDTSLRATELIDFRLNELRACPDEIKERFLRIPMFNINKIHYLIIRSSTDECDTSSNFKSRILENEIWQEYIDKLDLDMIAYHFKFKPEDKGPLYSFSNLSRFKYPFNTTKRIILYLIIAMLISILSSYIYEILSKHLHLLE